MTTDDAPQTPEERIADLEDEVSYLKGELDRGEVAATEISERANRCAAALRESPLYAAILENFRPASGTVEDFILDVRDRVASEGPVEMKFSEFMTVAERAMSLAVGHDTWLYVDPVGTPKCWATASRGMVPSTHTLLLRVEPNYRSTAETAAAAPPPEAERPAEPPAQPGLAFETSVDEDALDAVWREIRPAEGRPEVLMGEAQLRHAIERYLVARRRKLRGTTE